MSKLVISRNAKEDIKCILENVGEYTGSLRTIEKLRNEFLEKFNQINASASVLTGALFFAAKCGGNFRNFGHP